MAAERPPARLRSQSGAFSFKSEKSHHSKSSSKGGKISLVETEEEKSRQHMSQTTKANPNAAMNEAQPVQAAHDAPTIGSLRAVQHVDSYGQLIAEPDLSNPTRPRWERPLDTIRSFEAAIDSGYKERMPYSRPGTAMFSDSGAGYSGRRGSYFGTDHHQSLSRYSQQPNSGGYPSYYNRDPNGPGYGGPPRIPYGRRGQSEPTTYTRSQQHFQQQQQQHAQYHQQGHYGLSPGEGVYPAGPYGRSRDTVNTNGAAGSTGSGSEPWTSHTDPTSSENSSIDRIHPASGPPGYQRGAPIHEEQGYGSGGGYGQSQQRGAGPPPPPPHNQQYSSTGNAGPRRLMKLNSGGSSGGGREAAPPVPGKDAPGTGGGRSGLLQRKASEGGEKKESWLKRRFSRQR